LLAEKPSHGYELMVRLEERCKGGYQASAGVVYPTLQQMEDEGLVRSEAEDGKKVYKLTPKGQSEVTAQTGEIDDVWRRADAKGEWGVFRHPDAAEIAGPALRLAKAALDTVVKSRGDPAVVDDVRKILDDAREQITRIRKKGKA
jgi:DNA-binding PadR family transcriptional regulator